MLPIEESNLEFEATVPATEEAIVNAMLGAETMNGVRGSRVAALLLEQLVDMHEH